MILSEYGMLAQDSTHHSVAEHNFPLPLLPETDSLESTHPAQALFVSLLTPETGSLESTHLAQALLVSLLTPETGSLESTHLVQADSVSLLTPETESLESTHLAQAVYVSQGTPETGSLESIHPAQAAPVSLLTKPHALKGYPHCSHEVACLSIIELKRCESTHLDVIEGEFSEPVAGSVFS